MSVTSTFSVLGMTCRHCVSAVIEEVGAIDGVGSVAVDLVQGGTSTVTVTSDHDIDVEAVRAAVDEAGYELVDAA